MTLPDGTRKAFYGDTQAEARRKRDDFLVSYPNRAGRISADVAEPVGKLPDRHGFLFLAPTSQFSGERPGSRTPNPRIKSPTGTTEALVEVVRFRPYTSAFGL